MASKRPTARLFVRLCKHSKPAAAGGRTLRWSFSIADLAALFWVSHRRMLAILNEPGAIDPADLEAVCREWKRRERDISRL